MKSGRSCAVVTVLLFVGPLLAASQEVAPEAALVIVTGRSYVGEVGGNGFVLGDGTLVVTCDHLVFEKSASGGHRADMLVTVFSPYLGDACEAQVVASDEELDLAVLEIPWKGHPALSPADANALAAAGAGRVIGLPMAIRHMTDPDFAGGEAETFEPDQEELPISFIGIRRGAPRFVQLEGVGRLGPGWSGSPMLVPGTSVAIGCFAAIDKRGFVGGKMMERGAKGPALSQVSGLLGEGIGEGRLRRPDVCLKSPDDAREACSLALRASRSSWPGRYESALEPVRAFLKLRPDSVFGQRVLARASEETGQKDAARELYQRALELDPNSAHTRILYAQFLGENSEPNEARRILEPLWQSGRSRPLAAIALVNILGTQKDLGRCLEILEEAVKISPRNVYLWQQMAGCRMELQGPQAALEPTTRAVELCPERGPFRGGLAQLLERTGALDEAEKHFRKLLEVEPQNPVVYYWLAEFLSKHRPQSREEAVKVAEKALSLPSRASLPREEIEKLIKRIRDPAPSTVPE